MNSRHTGLRSLLLAILITAGTCVGAAEPTPANLATELAKSVQAARTAIPAPPKLVSIDFSGGSIRDFLSVVSKIEGVSISIISAGEASDLDTHLPPFSLRNTSPIVTLQVLSRLVMPRGFDLMPMDSGPSSAVAVLSRRESPKPAVRQAANEFESFQLAPYLTDQSIDDIVGAIRTAWELDPQRSPNELRLKFHPATSILLVSGPREGLHMAAKIISQLKVSRAGSPPSEKK